MAGATLGSAVLAGCGGGETNGDGGDTSEPTPTDATNERTATPTSKADATDTPAPTDSPTPTVTATASSTPTPEPTPTPVSDEESYSFNSQGETVTDEFSLAGGFTTFDMAHDGESNFQVELIDTSSGDTEEFLANEIGTWEGLIPYYEPQGDYVLDVNADGSWEIIVRQPRHTLTNADSIPVTGEDDYPNYLGPVEFEGFHTATGEYGGDSNFAVWLIDDDGQNEDLLFNEIGSFEGETTINYSGLGYIRVQATGSWRIDVE